MIKGVSCIITTKNEGKNIGDCINSILGPICPTETVEIIVVDNNSTDDTVKTAKKYTDKVFNHGPERSAQRNLGAKEATGKYLLYLDADMTLSKNVLTQCLGICETGKYIALYIPERIIGNGFWIKVRDFERSFYNATCIDCVRFVRRDKFLEISGFDENLTGPEDWDFDRRIKNAGKTTIINAPIFHNENGFNLKKYLKKKFYYSNDISKYVNKWGRNDLLTRKQIGFWYRYVKVFLENGKWKRFISSPSLVFGIYFLRISVGIGYLASTVKQRLWKNQAQEF